MPGSRARRRLGSQEGFALIEVVVSAAVLVIVVLGVMAASDAVSGTAGANKARTVAATLAEKDQEELRSLRTADLSQLQTYIPDDRTVTVDRVDYTIHSEAVWVADTTGEDISCEVPEGDGSYLRITSTVSSPMTGARVQPVTMSSIVAPQPGSGTLSAMVKDADARPVVNMPVQAVGPTPQTKTTNDAGCAVFSLLDAGSYDVKLDNAGWVDTEGNQMVVQTATVNPGILATVEFVYDLAARINPANIVTQINASPSPSPPPQSDEGNGVVLAHSGLQTGFRTFPASPISAVLAPDKLFPFRDPYKIYAGQCTGADPELYDPNYFEDNPTAAPKLNRGENFGQIDVLEPATRLVVRRGSGTRSNARVYAYPTHASCAGQRIDMGSTLSTPSGSIGTLLRPGLPFGDYRFCAQWTDTSSRTWYVFPSASVQNRNPNGTPASAATTLLIPSSPSGGNGTCPATA